MKRLFILSTAVWLCGCAASTVTYLPDGSRGHSIQCSGSAVSWAQCEQKAGSLCKSAGYEVISRHEDSGTSISGTPFGVFGGTTHNRSMLVKCNGQEPPEPPVTQKRKPGNPAMTH